MNSDGLFDVARGIASDLGAELLGNCMVIDAPRDAFSFRIRLPSDPPDTRRLALVPLEACCDADGVVDEKGRFVTAVSKAIQEAVK